MDQGLHRRLCRHLLLAVLALFSIAHLEATVLHPHFYISCLLLQGGNYTTISDWRIQDSCRKRKKEESYFATLLMRLSLTSMRCLKYPLLFAWTAVAAWLPAGGKRTADGRVPLRFKSYGDKASMWEFNRALHKRADDPVDYCRYWGQSSK